MLFQPLFQYRIETQDWDRKKARPKPYSQNAQMFTRIENRQRTTWPTGWQIDRPTHQPTNQPTNRLTNRPIVRPNDPKSRSPDPWTNRQITFAILSLEKWATEIGNWFVYIFRFRSPFSKISRCHILRHMTCLSLHTVKHYCHILEEACVPNGVIT